MNARPDSVFISLLSLSSRSFCTSSESSDPYVAVAIRHPPASGSFASSGKGFSMASSPGTGTCRCLVPIMFS